MAPDATLASDSRTEGERDHLDGDLYNQCDAAPMSRTVPDEVGLSLYDIERKLDDLQGEDR